MATDAVKAGEVVFIVGEHKVRCVALRGLLEITSPAFRQIFKDNDENKSDEIELLDTNPEAFQIMLEYINDINVKTKINEKNMCNVLYISTKYGLPKLIELSTKIVKSSPCLQCALNLGGHCHDLKALP